MPLPDLGGSYIAAAQAQKEVTANTDFDILADALSAELNIDCTTPSPIPSPMTPIEPAAYAAQAAMVLNLTGALTANGILELPNTPHLWVIRNQTTGGHSITIVTAASPAGSSVSTSAGDCKFVYSDGTNVISVS